MKRDKLQKILGVFVGLALIVLMGYMIWLGKLIYENMSASNDSLLESNQQQAVLTQTYSNLYIVTKIKLEETTAELEMTKKLYQESQAMLTTVSKELETTKAMLKETESLLAQAQAGSSQLKNEVLTVKDINEKQFTDMKVALEKTIKSLEGSNVELSNEVAALRDKLNYLSGEIRNTEEGRSLLSLYANRARLVKTKIKAFKKEAAQVRVMAQQERDKVIASVGNNGFMVRDGHTINVDYKKYGEAVTAPLKISETKAQPSRKVEIDVNFVK